MRKRNKLLCGILVVMLVLSGCGIRSEEASRADSHENGDKQSVEETADRIHEGRKTAPEIGESISVHWTCEPVEGEAGFDFVSTIKRTGETRIEVTETEIHVFPKEETTLDRKDAWVSTVSPQNAARTRATYTLASLVPVYITYSINADFVLEDGEIGYYMWFE